MTEIFRTLQSSLMSFNWKEKQLSDHPMACNECAATLPFYFISFCSVFIAKSAKFKLFFPKFHQLQKSKVQGHPIESAYIQLPINSNFGLILPKSINGSLFSAERLTSSIPKTPQTATNFLV